MNDTCSPAQAVAAVLRMDAWLDTMRSPQGYSGPVSHWWQSCMQFAGTGLDWRYEGIVDGYLTLFQRSGQTHWLEKARRAGDDLLHGQLANGNFMHSAFELNPSPGGTPHEAACDIALLQLAQVLREHGDAGWQGYANAAEQNLRAYWIGRLWDEQARYFRDDPAIASFVPNKAATLCEALFLLAECNAEADLIERYALPTLDAVLRFQVRGGPLDGAICQNTYEQRTVEKYLPYYVARCVPALLRGYQHTSRAHYLDGALRALGFVLRTQYEDGSFPQAVYPGGTINRYPQWVAAVGDILRAIELARPYGVAHNTAPIWGWLLRGQQPSGGVATAYGFGSQVFQWRPGNLPDIRDLLPVCGWSDKAFRALAAAVPPGAELGPVATTPFETAAQFRGKRGIWQETDHMLRFTVGTRTTYQWNKGQTWAEPGEWGALWK